MAPVSCLGPQKDHHGSMLCFLSPDSDVSQGKDRLRISQEQGLPCESATKGLGVEEWVGLYFHHGSPGS